MRATQFIKGVAESYDSEAFPGIKFLNPETGKMGPFYYWSSMEGKNDAYSMITNKKLVPAHNDGTPMTWDEYKQALDGGYQGVAEGNQEEKIGGRYDADEFDSMVSRLKKLAGAGPMKTVYDPDRRVYRNMPTAVQPAQQPKKAPR
jgi:hypothetical protein